MKGFYVALLFHVDDGCGVWFIRVVGAAGLLSACGWFVLGSEWLREVE